MLEKVLRHIWNGVSGLLVLASSLWLSSGPGIAETETPDYRWYFMLWFVLWVIGFALQFKQRTKWIGLFITFIPTIYYIVKWAEAI